MRRSILFFLSLMMVVFLSAQTILPGNVKKQPVATPAVKNNPGLQLDSSVMVSKSLSITPTAIRNLCPRERTAGDNEFGDNELHIEVSVSYQGDNGRDRTLNARIFISATERGGDGSSVRQTFLIPVYTAPEGYAIKQITSSNRSTSFTIETRDKERGKPVLAGACTTYVYNLSKASLGFDLVQGMLSDMRINTRNVNGTDFNESEGFCDCGFSIQSIAFRPVDIVIVKKTP